MRAGTVTLEITAISAATAEVFKCNGSVKKYEYQKCIIRDKHKGKFVERDTIVNRVNT